MVKDAIKRTRGAAGSSGMDADGWRCILISGKFGDVGEEPQKSIAKMAEILCQGRSANYLAAFLACRLIPLDKQPGVEAIGIGEVLRQVIGKIVMKLLRKDRQQGPYSFVLVKTLEVKQQLTQFICSMKKTLKRC